MCGVQQVVSVIFDKALYVILQHFTSLAQNMLDVLNK